MTAKRDRAIGEIEREIASTRIRLGHAGDAVAAALAPSHLVEKGAAMLKNFLGPLGARAPDGGMRADPAALALIGLGVAWLVAENIGLLARNHLGARGKKPAAPDPVPQNGNREPRDDGGAGESAPARSRLADNHILLGLGALAAGASLALLLPPTRREREIAAKAREELWDKAEELGHRAAAAMREIGDRPEKIFDDC